MLPELGDYAVGNIFGKGDSAQRQAFQSVFSDIANNLGLRVLGWRQVPPMNLFWIRSVQQRTRNLPALRRLSFALQ